MIFDSLMNETTSLCKWEMLKKKQIYTKLFNTQIFFTDKINLVPIDA